MENSLLEPFDAAGDSPSTNTAVTKVIDRIPREGMDAQLEQRLTRLFKDWLYPRQN